MPGTVFRFRDVQGEIPAPPTAPCVSSLCDVCTLASSMATFYKHLTHHPLLPNLESTLLTIVPSFERVPYLGSGFRSDLSWVRRRQQHTRADQGGTAPPPPPPPGGTLQKGARPCLPCTHKDAEHTCQLPLFLILPLSLPCELE